jgi:hypothetical protein
MNDIKSASAPSLPKHRFKWFLAGLAFAALGWCALYAVGSLMSTVSTQAIPPYGASILLGCVLLLPGLAYLAWSHDRHRTWGLGYKLAGLLFGLVVPVALFIGLLSLVPHGD